MLRNRWFGASLTAAAFSLSQGSPRVRPGDDFFGYANAEWLARTTIPMGRERWTSRNEIDQLTARQIADLLDGAATAPTGSLARKVADFRAAWLNTGAIEANGLTPLQPALDSIAGLGDKTALTRLLGRWLPADVDPLNFGVYRSSHVLGLAVQFGLHGEPTPNAYLVQGGLGLPRDRYLGTDAGMVAERARYQSSLERLLTLAGLDRPGQRAQAVLALETALATFQATPEASANDNNADHRWTRSDFSQRAPGMDWFAFFEAAGLARQEEFVAWQPAALTGLASLVGSQPLDVWKDYLRVRLLDRYADVLPRPYAEAILQPSAGTRADRALQATQSQLGDALGRIYVERHFPPAQKARLHAVVANVIEAFIRRIETVPWMSPEAREVARAKLRALYFGIGYPDRWQDYSRLAVDARDPVGNLRRIAARRYALAVSRLGKPVDRTEWVIDPQVVGAVLIFQLNVYNFSAGLLQPPRFDSTQSDAATYGGIGAIVGHEVSHFIDVLGREYGVDGGVHGWWSAEDSTRFDAAAERLVQQYQDYRPFADLGLDGRKARTENVADLAGLSVAFDAYRRTLGSRALDAPFVREQDREFFLGFARAWRSKISDGGLRQQIASDNHAPDSYRIATVRNLAAWYDAFDVRPGQKLYLAPEARVRIW